MSKEVLDQKSCPETKMDSTQRCGDEADVRKDQQVVPMMKKVKVPVGCQNKALNCTNCKVTCHYPCNSNISTAESSCPAMEDVGPALESNFVSVSWACKVCPGHCPGGVHKYEDVKWDHVKETMDSMDQQLNEEGITKGWKKDIEKALEEITLRLNRLEMKAPANDPPTRSENIQEMITTEDNKKPAGEDEKIKGLCEITTKDNKSTEQIPERKPLECKLDWDNMICSGYYRAIYRGSFNGKQVAIKRVPTDKIQFQEKEENILGQLDHPNVIKLLQVTQDIDYRFYVFELAAGTVDDFCLRIYRGKMPSDDEALKQMAAGLLYIHEKRFAHLNISPYSVYISTSEPVRLMIAKFGSCEPTTDAGTFSMGYDNKGGESDWMAPEILEYVEADSDDDDGEQSVKIFSIACDTWSLGCLFFYFLTRGIHPYGEEDDAIRWNIVVKQNPAELEAMQASNHEEVYDLIRDMIETEPKKRISLGTVVMRLETLFPPSATSCDSKYRKDDQPNPTATTSGASSCEKMSGVEGKFPDVCDKEGDNTDHTGLEKEVKCCTHCDTRLKEMEETREKLEKSLESVQEKLDYSNRSAICSILKSEAAGKIRIVSTLYQLVKCYSEAKDEEWTEKDVNKNCQRVIDHLKAVNSEHHFCSWYYSQAKQKQKGLAPELAAQIQSTPILSPQGKINWNIVKLYQDSGKLKNYLSGPITNWNDFHEPSGPIFFLALYQSVKDKTDLLSFPPAGLLTMDVPLQISTAISSVHIQVGEIKSTNKEKVMTYAKLQLRRSLLCFKWLDELLSPKQFSYGLIGNIYITGSCSTTQKENESKKDDEDCLKEEGIVIYRKYKM